MEFLYPGFLYALAALAIPIIIHLFNFRRFKKVPFTNVRFLREIKLQTQSHNRLRHLLILLMRLLAVAFLVLAFAQPFIPEAESTAGEGVKSVSIFVDNSFSMEGETADGMMLEVAKNRALDIARGFAPTDRFQLLTQDFTAGQQRLVTRSEFNEMVQNIEVSPRSHNLNEIIDRQNDLLKFDAPEKGRSSFIISDFQKSRFSFSELHADSTIPLSLVHIPRNSPDNLYIDSAWFATPVRKTGASDALTVRIANTGSDAVNNVPLRLSINGRQVSIGSVGLPANSVADTTLYFVNTEPGIQRLKVELDDSPVTYDNDYYLAYKVIDHIRVTAIVSNPTLPDPYLSAVYRGDSTFTYQRVGLTEIDYAKLPESDLIILNELDDIPSGLAGELIKFSRNGGSVWMIPAADVNMESYNAFLAEIGAGSILETVTGKHSVRNLNSENPLYTGVFERLPKNLDLPVATRYYKFSSSLRTPVDNAMRFGNGDTFLGSYSPGRGKFYVLAVPLRSADNNFSRHALFVATALRMAEVSRATAILSTDLGSVFTLSGISAGNNQVFHLTSADGETDVIPKFADREGRVEINPGPDITAAGNYNILLGSDTIGAVGLNYPRSESDLASYTRSELEEAVAGSPWPVRIYDGNSEQLTRLVEKADKGTELWKLCLILVLIFLLAETALLRFWKK